MTLPSIFPRPISFVFGVVLSLFCAGSGQADTVTLKNGTKIEGRITFEAADMIRVEVKLSETIKETKTIAKADISEIVKTKPDLIAFAELEKIMPVPSLLNAEQYRNFISKGPEKFLRDFPGSEKKAEVEKMLAGLNEELDKAERGFVKVGEIWYSPEEKDAHPALVESDILRFKMLQAAKAGQNLAALREFEQLEKKYYGSPAYAEALPAAVDVVRALGQQLSASLNDADFRKKQYEDGLAAMNELDRANTVAARQAEADAHKATLEEERKSGIRWTVIDVREKTELDTYVRALQTEYQRLQTFDQEGLKKLATTLKTADDLMTEDKFGEARLKLNEAKGVTVVKIDPKADPKKKVQAPIIKGSSSYEKSIADLLSAKEKAAAAAQRAAAAAQKANSVAKMIKGADGEAGKEGDPAAPTDSASDLGDLLATKTDAKGKEPEKKSPTPTKKPTKKTTSTKSSSSAEDPDGVTAKKKPTASSGGGGGLSFQTIMFLVTGLLGLTVLVLKLLGVGKAKSE